MSRILIRIALAFLVLVCTPPTLRWGGHGHKIVSKIPAVNNAGAWVLWAFIEFTDPWDAQNRIRALLATAPDAVKGDPHADAT